MCVCGFLFFFLFFSIEEVGLRLLEMEEKGSLQQKRIGFPKWDVVVTGGAIVLTEYFLRNGPNFSSQMLRKSFVGPF